MNFQTVEENNGNLVSMLGVFVEIGGLQYTPQQKAKAICKIQDDAGVAHNVHIYQGKGQLPTQLQLNQRHQFNLSTFQGHYQNRPYTGYSGFWDSTSQVSSAPSTPQQGQRGPSQPSQPAQRPNAGGDKEMHIIRGNSLNAIMSATDVPLDMVGDYLATGVQWIMTGTWSLKQKPATQEEVTGREPGEDIPY